MTTLYDRRKRQHHDPHHARRKPRLYRIPNTSARRKSSLQNLAGKWPAARLIQIWNSIPGNTPVKKFTTGRRR